MMDDFKIGDAVRLRMGGITELPLVIRSMKDSICLCVSECGNWSSWEADYSLELVNRPDPQADIKQAIREVLLSEEFMKAFAAAWMKTPIPYVHDISFDNLKPGETLTGNYVWLGEPAEEHPVPGVNQPMKNNEPTKAQQLAERTIKAIWQANDGGNQ